MRAGSRCSGRSWCRLALPAPTILGLLTFMDAWNDFLWPLVPATNAGMYAVTLGIASIQGNVAFAQSEGLGSVTADAAFASIPIVVLSLIFQRFIVSSASMGADH